MILGGRRLLIYSTYDHTIYHLLCLHRAGGRVRLFGIVLDPVRGDHSGARVGTDAAFFLECIRVAANNGVKMAQDLSALLNRDRQALLGFRGATIPAIRLFDRLPCQPMITLPRTVELLETTKPTAAKAIEALRKLKILREVTGKQRDRIYAYHGYLELLTKETE